MLLLAGSVVSRLVTVLLLGAAPPWSAGGELRVGTLVAINPVIFLLVAIVVLIVRHRAGVGISK